MELDGSGSGDFGVGVRGAGFGIEGLVLSFGLALETTALGFSFRGWGLECGVKTKPKRKRRAWVRVASMVIMLRDVKLFFQMPAAFVAARERGSIRIMSVNMPFNGTVGTTACILDNVQHSSDCGGVTLDGHDVRCRCSGQAADLSWRRLYPCSLGAIVGKPSPVAHLSPPHHPGILPPPHEAVCLYPPHQAYRSCLAVAHDLLSTASDQ